ncbi:hypothetical protein EXIGLDRAFT_718888 [Exidia glandulosa HHB12029]|uniref:Uncharacterized protein n=1 Tax=Exidia glandulosa HHB12029 TaxID=1314781 RepID=A0A166AHA8_EXIGL|nr:hypothetical protein EXIGLDRAFT_718888 [Exidia glandulosa HHB12029]
MAVAGCFVDDFTAAGSLTLEVTSGWGSRDLNAVSNEADSHCVSRAHCLSASARTGWILNRNMRGWRDLSVQECRESVDRGLWLMRASRVHTVVRRLSSLSPGKRPVQSPCQKTRDTSATHIIRGGHRVRLFGDIVLRQSLCVFRCMCAATLAFSCLLWRMRTGPVLGPAVIACSSLIPSGNSSTGSTS